MHLCFKGQAFKRALLFLFFLLFPTFLICSYFSLLFHENALLSLLFHSKISLTRKNQEIFLARFASSSFINKLLCLSRSHAAKHLKNLFLTRKVSLFNWCYCDRYYPAHLVRFSLFHTTPMNFVLGKALLSLLFSTDNPYFFTTFSEFLSLLFPYFSVDGHLKA